MDDIVKRLQGSLKYDAFNGSYNERAICISQVEEAISLIDQLRAERDEIREAWEPLRDKVENAKPILGGWGYELFFGVDHLRKLAKLIGKE